MSVDGVLGMDVAGDEGTYPLKSQDCTMYPGNLLCYYVVLKFIKFTEET